MQTFLCSKENISQSMNLSANLKLPNVKSIFSQLQAAMPNVFNQNHIATYNRGPTREVRVSHFPLISRIPIYNFILVLPKFCIIIFTIIRVRIIYIFNFITGIFLYLFIILLLFIIYLSIFYSWYDN